MKQLIYLKQILLSALLLLATVSRAQDFIGYRLQHVQDALRKEKANFVLQEQDEQIKLLLVEGADISIWTFDEDSICTEYILIMDGNSYRDLQRFLRFTCWRINDQTFINKRNRIISQISEESNVFVLRTRKFDPTIQPSEIFYSSDERRATR